MSNFVLKGSHDTDKPVSRLTCVARSLGLVDLASRVMKTPTCFLAFDALARLFGLAERILDDVPFPRIMAESVWVVVSDAGRPCLFGCLRPLVTVDRVYSSIPGKEVGSVTRMGGGGGVASHSESSV